MHLFAGINQSVIYYSYTLFKYIILSWDGIRGQTNKKSLISPAKEKGSVLSEEPLHLPQSLDLVYNSTTFIIAGFKVQIIRMFVITIVNS